MSVGLECGLATLCRGGRSAAPAIAHRFPDRGGLVRLGRMRDRRRRWEVIGPGAVVIGPGTGQWQWRGLFEDLLAYQGDDWAGDVIDSWALQHPGVIAELHAIGAPGNHRARVTWRRGEYSALEGLYALGRVLDVLAAPYQPANQDPTLLSWSNGRPWWTGWIPDQGALPAFADAIGAARISEEKFTRSSTRSAP